MKIAIASFTRNGCAWNRKLCAALKKHSCEGYALEKYGKEAGIPAIAPSLPAWTERMFQKMDAILFIGACGIAVRSIAPYVKSKKTDPAVLCMDEQGKFVISLLSGHIGGANELTEEVAAVTGAVPVITTATDVNHKFAVDVFAVKIIVKFVRWSWQKRQRRFWWTEKRLDSAAVFRWMEQNRRN